MKNCIHHIIAVLICTCSGVWASGTVDISESSTSAQAALPASSHAETVDRMDALVSTKMKGVIAGNGLFFAGALIHYGLIVPKTLTLDPLDPEDGADYFALISPNILETGLRFAGPPMAAMRISETINAYESIAGVPPPLKHLSWTLYFTGWGFTVAAGAVNVLGLYVLENENISNASLVVAGCGDVAWAASCVYSLWYLRKLRGGAVKRDTQSLSVVPLFNRDGSFGAALSLKF